MEYRKLDQAINNYGFRVQYNRLFKTEYLPARVRYNTFFFFAVAGSLYAVQRSKVSMIFQSFVICLNFSCQYYSCGVSLMSLRPILAKDAIIAFPVASLIQSLTVWTDRAWPRTMLVLLSLSERSQHKNEQNETYIDHTILFNIVQKYIH